MSPEERDELMDFILQSQSNATKRMDEFRADLQILAAISHDLVEVARRHDHRLDDLEDLNP
jgi:hypothetical protein